MTSINTNLSSLIVQKNLTKSTNALDKALERLTTGFKINHASDNAANYSISESMSSKLSSYMVAEDNTSMGLDLIRTQSSTLDTIQNLTTRLRALAEQAHNGTYGAQSLEAINQEAGAIIDEITRIGNNAEYNGIKLFDNALSQAGIPQLKSNGLMQEIERRDTSGMTKLADVDASSPLAAGTYSISTAEELAKLATIVNNGDNVANCEFVLGADIDLSAYSEGRGWIEIGTEIEEYIVSTYFSGTFDGNGYTISNLYINTDCSEYSVAGNIGLFGDTENAAIKNVVLKDCDINVSSDDNIKVGGLAGCAHNSTITNCTVTGNVKSDCNQGNTGLLVGECTYNYADTVMENCYTSGSLQANYYAGGIVGKLDSSVELTVQNCFSEANVISKTHYAGGLFGYSNADIVKNCGVSGDISGVKGAGGLFGAISTGFRSVEIENAIYAGSSVTTETEGMGGVFIGMLQNRNALPNIKISGSFDSALSGITKAVGRVVDSEKFVSNISDVSSQLQVGVDSTDSSNIKFTTNMSLSAINSLRIGGMEGTKSLENIDAFISKLSEAQTKLGAIENRLTSTIESIGVNIENLTSSRSTLKDADVAKESSQMLKNQILQQASATLLATANQTPALALRLLGGM